MNEFEALLMGMGRCNSCGRTLNMGFDNIVVSSDDDNAVTWHFLCQPLPPHVPRQVLHWHLCRQMAALN